MVGGCIGPLLALYSVYACLVLLCSCACVVYFFGCLPFFFAVCVKFKHIKEATDTLLRLSVDMITSCVDGCLVLLVFPRVTVNRRVRKRVLMFGDDSNAIPPPCSSILWCFVVFFFCFSGKGEEQEEEEEGAEDAGFARQALKDSMKKARKADADYESDVSKKNWVKVRKSETQYSLWIHVVILACGTRPCLAFSAYCLAGRRYGNCAFLWYWTLKNWFHILGTNCLN